MNGISQINKEISFTAAAEGASEEKLQSLNVIALTSNSLKYPERDTKGWTILTPSADSRLIYVSSSEGDDNSAATYNSSEVADPLNPGSIAAFKTIAAAVGLVREGYPDWILLKKGDEWTIDHVVGVLGSGGRSMSEPIVFTSYGSEKERPLIKTSGRNGFQSYGSQSFITVVGLDFYAYQRDPNSVDFVGWDNLGSPVGFKCLTDTVNDNESIVLEDNIFRYFSGNIVFDGAKRSKNIIIRRNHILNSFSVSGHGQGVYVKNSTILMEDNLLDHNGWYQHNYGVSNDSAEGQATMFNHNAYLVNINDSIISSNIITRASSIGLKFTSNSEKTAGINTINVSNVLIKNNLIIEGEIGISIGGNTDFQNGVRWEGINIVGNVLINTGNSMPTGRALAWGIIADDWKAGSLVGNFLLFNDNTNILNIIGIAVTGASTGVTVNSNVMYDLGAKVDQVIFVKTFEQMSGLLIYDNFINSYYGSGSWIRRDINTYMQEQGEEEGLSSFVTLVNAQSKSNWNNAFTADVINRYMKSQFKN